MTETIDAIATDTFQAPAVRQMTPGDWSMIKEQSATLEQAGKGTSILPKGITNRYQIAAILQKGFELGLSPMYSLEQIGLVNGKPVVQGQALLAIIQRSHGGQAVQMVESTHERATFRFKRRDKTEATEFTWTVDDAKRAGLFDKGSVWKQYTRTMLRWRCIAEGARIEFADVIGGLYLPDELGVPSKVDAGGNLVIDHDTWQGSGVQVREEPRIPPSQDLDEAWERLDNERGFEVEAPVEVAPGQEVLPINETFGEIPFKPASANQEATIARLYRELGMTEQPEAGMSSAAASERITKLLRQYNERRAAHDPREKA